MKVFIFILNIYILILALLPCGDRDEVYHHGSSISRTTAVAGEEAHHDEVCPPFCTCACCGMSKAIPSAQIAGQHIFSLLTIKFSTFLFSSPKEVSLSIWQPPQLA